MKLFATPLTLALLAGPLFAQGKPDTDQRIAELEKKLEALLAEKNAPKAKLASGAEDERVLAPVGLTAFYDNGYLVGTSNDGAFKYWLDGRINLDGAWYDGSDNRLAGGVEVRRGRIGLKATLFGDWLGEVDLDFADNTVEIKDMWMGYAGFKNSVIRIGNHKAPFGLDSLTSSKNIVFMERAYVDAWAPDRLLGLSYSRWGKSWQGSVGLFGQPGGEFNDKDTQLTGGAGTQKAWGYVGRFSMAPLNEKGKVLHFGLAYNHRTPDAATLGGGADRLREGQMVKFDTRAETHVTRAKFLSTGDIKFTDHYTQTGLEAAGVFGPLHFQAEYQTTKVSRTQATLPSFKFSGYYGQVGWFLTGERRPYSSTEGEFGRVIPKGRFGAWELALRYSTLNLNDRLDEAVSIKGGEVQSYTLALNWYINANHKFMLNFARQDHDAIARPKKDFAPLPVGTSTTFTPVGNDDFNTFSIRYQLAF